MPELQTIATMLAKALAARGVTDLAIRADGGIYRFDAPDKRRGNLAGWYVPCDLAACEGRKEAAA